MKAKEIKVFQIQHIVTRVEDSERIIFEKYEDGWVYHAPNVQNHNVEQLEVIIAKIKELNND